MGSAQLAEHSLDGLHLGQDIGEGFPVRFTFRDRLVVDDGDFQVFHSLSPTQVMAAAMISPSRS